MTWGVRFLQEGKITPQAEKPEDGQ